MSVFQITVQCWNMLEYVSLSVTSDLRLTVVSTQAQFSVAQLESEEHTNTLTLRLRTVGHGREQGSLFSQSSVEGGTYHCQSTAQPSNTAAMLSTAVFKLIHGYITTLLKKFKYVLINKSKNFFGFTLKFYKHFLWHYALIFLYFY